MVLSTTNTHVSLPSQAQCASLRDFV